MQAQRWCFMKTYIINTTSHVSVCSLCTEKSFAPSYFTFQCTDLFSEQKTSFYQVIQPPRIYQIHILANIVPLLKHILLVWLVLWQQIWILHVNSFQKLDVVTKSSHVILLCALSCPRSFIFNLTFNTSLWKFNIHWDLPLDVVALLLLDVLLNLFHEEGLLHLPVSQTNHAATWQC